MKQHFSIRILIAALIVFPYTSCKKNTDYHRAPELVEINTAPIANAGSDIRLEIPTNHTWLTGSAIDAENNIIDYSWKKISGPESYFLEWNYHRSPYLLWLEEGEYEFEFKTTDSDMLTDKDTVKVTIFSNLRKHIVHNLTPDVLGFSVAQIPAEVRNNIKWVFAKSSGSCEQADAGPNPNIDYTWGGYYYDFLQGNTISVYGGYTGLNLDVIIYY